jgi:pyruvate/2-oxoacid:ferredoxin oxidoreductase alpha subunit
MGILKLMLSTHRLLKQLRQKELVIVPELNYQGQFSMVLRSMGVNAISITQYTGLPFKVKDLVERVTEQIESYKQGNK